MEKQKTKKAQTKSVVATRGRTFQGEVTKKFEKRVVVELSRTVYIKKYERFSRRKTRLHARVPEGFSVEVGDVVKVRECRPLSKIIHFAVVDKVKEGKQ